MADRYFCPELTSAGDYVLTGPELHHLRTVCRTRCGDRIEVFNGRGGWGTAEVIGIDRGQAVVRVERVDQAGPETSGLVLACPLPKGDRAAWLVEKCTELGVSRLVALATERTVRTPGAGRIERLERTVIEACKQCGRRTLMQLTGPVSWKELVTAADRPAWMLHPVDSARSLASADRVPAIVAVGPEGGWSDDEADLGTRNGWQLIRLPGALLRVETAGVALASWARLRSGTA